MDGERCPMAGPDQAACPTSAAASLSSMARSSTYDTFDRATATTVTGTGAGSASYVYDVLGRALSVPQVDIAGSALVATGLTYFANDLAASQSQAGGSARTFGLDVLRRLNTWTDTTGIVSTVVTNHYDGMGDSPAWTTSSDGTTTTVRRNILGLDGTLALTATVVGTGTVSATLNIVNPHGDVFTTIPDVVNVTAAQVGACNDTDEFGIALTPSAPSYGWVGGKLRATNTATGLIQMGVRVYDPIIGRFLSPDPVYGGNDNSYTYPVDPMNAYDLSGKCWGWHCEWVSQHGRGIVQGAVVTVAVFSVCGLSAGIACPLAVGLGLTAAFGYSNYRADHPREGWRSSARNWVHHGYRSLVRTATTAVTRPWSNGWKIVKFAFRVGRL